MENLIKAIQTVANKFKDVDLEIDRDIVRLRVKDIQDIVEVTERDGKLHVLVLPSHHKEEVDLARVEDIINILQKQANTPQKTDIEIEEIKAQYKQGMTVRLKKMYDLDAPAAGTLGKIYFVDDSGTLRVEWQSGRSLGLVEGLDEFDIVDEVENNEIQLLKQKYEKGTRIKLIQLHNHPAPTPNFIGEVDFVDKFGYIHIKLLQGRTVAVKENLDKFEILGKVEINGTD